LNKTGLLDSFSASFRRGTLIALSIRRAVMQHDIISHQKALALAPGGRCDQKPEHWEH
jgi:hypothetical protein